MFLLFFRDSNAIGLTPVGCLRPRKGGDQPTSSPANWLNAGKNCGAPLVFLAPKTTVSPFSHKPKGERQTGTVHPLTGWTGFVQMSRLGFRLNVTHDCPALLCPVYTIGNLSTGLSQTFLRELGEVSQQVPSRLSYGNRFCPLPVYGPGSEPEREGCLTSIMRTVRTIKDYDSIPCQVFKGSGFTQPYFIITNTALQP